MELEKLLNNYSKNEEDILSSFDGDEFEKVSYILNSLKWIMNKLFSDDIVELYFNRVLHFAKTIHSLWISWFDSKLKELILKIWWKNLINNWNVFEIIDEYESLISEIKSYKSIDASTFKSNFDIDEQSDFNFLREKVELEINKLESMYQDVSKLNGELLILRS